MPGKLQKCGACGWDIAPTRYPGSNVEIDSDPLSQQVEARLLEIAPSLSRPLPDWPTPHPLCTDCFVGWLHLWLGVGTEVRT